MDRDLFFNGKQYISAKEASRITGYSSDYIGQLCRGGKLESRIVGKKRYVTSLSLQKYLLSINEIEKGHTLLTKKSIKKGKKISSSEKVNLSKKITGQFYQHYPSIFSQLSGGTKTTQSLAYDYILKRALMGSLVFLLSFSMTSAYGPSLLHEALHETEQVYTLSKKIPTVIGQGLTVVDVTRQGAAAEMTDVSKKIFADTNLFSFAVLKQTLGFENYVGNQIDSAVFTLAGVRPLQNSLSQFSLSSSSLSFANNIYEWSEQPEKNFSMDALSYTRTYDMNATLSADSYLSPTAHDILAMAREKISEGSSSVTVAEPLAFLSGEVYDNLQSITDLYGDNLVRHEIIFGSHMNGVAGAVRHTSVPQMADAVGNSLLDTSRTILNSTVSLEQHVGEKLALAGSSDLSRNPLPVLALANATNQHAQLNTFDETSLSIYHFIRSLFNKPTDNTGTLTQHKNSTTEAPFATLLYKTVTAQDATTTRQQRTNAPQTIVQRITQVDQPIIQQVSSGVSQLELNQALQNLSSSFDQRLASFSNSLSSGNGGSITNVYNEISAAQRIDNLSGTQISNPTITGGTVSGISLSANDISGSTIAVSGTGTLGTTTIASLTVGNSSTSTFAGGINLSAGCVSINGTCIGGGSNLSFTYPLVNTANTISLAFGTTTNNTWSGINTFTATSTLDGLTISGQGTTTANVGFNITTGCYAINGTCVSGGSGTGASTTLLSDANTFTGLNNFTNKLSLSTSSPFAQLSINSIAGEPAFVVGSSTGTSFIVDKSGNVGVGTSSPNAALSVDATSGNILNLTNNGTSEFSVSSAGTPTISGTNLLFTKNQTVGILNNNTNSLASLNITGGKNAASFLSLQSTGGVGTSDYIKFLVGNNGATEAGRFTTNGSLGLATTSPFARLSVAGSDTSTTLIGADALSGFTGNLIDLKIASTTKFAVSGSGFGTTTLSGLSINGSATSTANVGFNITTGCYAVNGICVSGGGGTGASTTLLSDANTFSGLNNFTNSLSLSTSSPFGQLSVNSIAGQPALVVGSSTATSFIVDKSGNVGVGTSNPAYNLDVTGTGRITGGLNIGSQTNAITGQVKATVLSGTSYFEGPGAYFNTAQPYGSNNDMDFTLRNSSNKFEFQALGNTPVFDILNNGNVGIGTSSPQALLAIGTTSSTDKTGGLYFGGDTSANLYRSGAGTLKTDAGLTVNGSLILNSYLSGPTIYGSSFDGQFNSNTVFGLRGASYNYDFQDSTGSNHLLTILNNGNVGIGTSSPQALLEVGTTSSSDASGGLYFGGDTSANVYRSTAGTIKTDGSFAVGNDLLFTHLSRINNISNSSQNLLIQSTFTNTIGSAISLRSSATINPTSGVSNIVSIGGTSSIGSGSANLNTLQLVTTFNQTGSASGITRDIYSNPTLTSAYDFRALETAGSTYNLSVSTTTLQSVAFNPFTFASTTAATLTNAYNENITGAPVASTNVTISTSTALAIQGGAVNGGGTVTNAYGLQVYAPTGATNNYAAAFLNGFVGIGTSSPQALLAIGTTSSTDKTGGLYFGGDTSADLYRSAAGVIKTDGSLAVGGRILSTGNSLGQFTINGHPQGSTPTTIIKFSEASGALTPISGTDISVAVDASTGFAPTSGSAVYHALDLQPTINQTGTASGITRDLYMDPTLTSAYDYRSLETAAITSNLAISTTTLVNVLLNPLTYASTTATTLTNAIGTYIPSAPIAGSNLTISTSTALLIGSPMPTLGTASSVNGGGTVTNAYGLQVYAPTGATNNYAAAFLNGFVGIGTSSPQALLEVGTTSSTDKTGGLYFGGDTSANLYRSAAGTIRTDGIVNFEGVASISGNTYNVTSGNGITLNSQLTSAAGNGISIANTSTNMTYTSGTGSELSVGATYAPISGTGVFNNSQIIGTINQTGSASGITRGLYSNPTLTSAYDFRALETAGSTYNLSVSTTTLQSVAFNPFTFASTTAATLTNAYNENITGAPVASTNVTISTSTALAIQGGAVNGGGTVTNAYGLQVYAPTGATNNYAAAFLNGSVGVGTSSPWAQLAVNPNALGSGVPEFVVGSSSATHLVVTGGGNVGIGTMTPTASLYVNGTFVASSTSNAIIGNGTTGGIQLGDSTLTKTAGGGFQFGSSVSVAAGTVGLPGLYFNNTSNGIYLPTSNQLGFVTNNNERVRIDSNGNVGIGTTTPWSTVQLSIASNTPVVDLISNNAATNAKHIQISNVAGTFAIGTSSDTSTATSSAALQLTPGVMPQFGLGTSSPWAQLAVNPDSYLGSGVPEFVVGSSSATHLIVTGAGQLGIGTSSPWRTLDVNGTVGIKGLTVSTTGNYLCINTTTNEIESGTTCTLSSSRFKTNIQPLSAATSTGYASSLDEVMALQPMTFNFIQGYGDNGASLQIGFIAEQAATVDPRLVPFDAEGKPAGFFYQEYTAVLTQAVQELNTNVDSLASTSPYTTAGQNFATAFFTRMFSRLIGWFADATNGIDKFFANEIHTHKVCVYDDSGASTCITKSQLDALLASAGTASAASTPASTTGTSPSSSTTTVSVDTSVPVLTVQGNNPAQVSVGSSYVDLGVTVTDTNATGGANNNLDIYASVDGAATTTPDQILIDTSAPGTHTIVYSAADQAGNTGYATRTVNVVSPTADSPTNVSIVTSTSTSSPVTPVTTNTATTTATSTTQ